VKAVDGARGARPQNQRFAHNIGHYRHKPRARSNVESDT
jgi:hypothetical protein